MPSIDMPTIIIGSTIIACILLVSGFALNNMLDEDGYGPFGNTAILMLGFFGVLKALPELGYRVYTLPSVIFIGFGGAFGLIMLMVILKAALSRMFPEG
ncbi:hypothetical protein B7H23_07410 [Notoacmeibacter marinus]|uniref:GlsB/YeaQ/YmgE family stress response membrane protein n=1 Tax=Notoacmeibacter marinus TaxID=1876515 RepID=A0A231V3E2_9HYPH|nr:hypothetical protein [Notoacmeibacter marinus]OXT02703.1 hypothetical protein B7H23_07410 [Notoacmeibacter marinus]